VCPQLLNVHRVNELRQTEIHKAEPLADQPSGFEVEIAIEHLKTHKSPGTDHITVELIRVHG
jgi:hypothetical protein